jgi:hypothetical protein
MSRIWREFIRSAVTQQVVNLAQPYSLGYHSNISGVGRGFTPGFSSARLVKRHRLLKRVNSIQSLKKRDFLLGRGMVGGASGLKLHLAHRRTSNKQLDKGLKEQE